MRGTVRSTTALGRGLVAFARGDWAACVAQLSAVDGTVDLYVAELPRLLALVQQGEHVRDDVETRGRRALVLARAEAACAREDAASAREGLRDYLLDDELTPYGMVFGVHALRRFAGTSLAAEHIDEAVRLLAAAAARAEQLGMSLDTGFARMTAGEQTAAENAVDAGRFAQLWNEGAAMAWDDVIAYLARGRGQRRRRTSGWESLTPTERQVVSLLREGLANKAISEKLFMSVATVKSHLTHAYAKLGVASRAELLAGEIASQHPHS
jgi:DNA-binding CsgD family transcriptional regulator